MTTKTLIGYIRVSTKEQGRSKNGLEAQREAIELFARANNYHLIDIVEEVASGGLGYEDRPVLQEATIRAQRLKAHLVVSKLDRLSRSSAFIGNLMNNTRVKFIVIALGEDVDSFMLHVHAAVAEHERKQIAERTRVALERVKAKGKVLGASPDVIAKAVAKSGAAQAARADDFANRLKPTIQRMRSANMSLRQIADELNKNGTRTARGGEWAASTVNNLIARF